MLILILPSFSFLFSVFPSVTYIIHMGIFSVKDFSATSLVMILKFGTKLDSDILYCIAKMQPHISYHSLYLFISFFSVKLCLSKISQQLLDLGF